MFLGKNSFLLKSGGNCDLLPYGNIVKKWKQTTNILQSNIPM